MGGAKIPRKSRSQSSASSSHQQSASAPPPAPAMSSFSSHQNQFSSGGPAPSSTTRGSNGWGTAQSYSSAGRAQSVGWGSTTSHNNTNSHQAIWGRSSRPDDSLNNKPTNKPGNGWGQNPWAKKSTDNDKDKNTNNTNTNSQGTSNNSGSHASNEHVSNSREQNTSGSSSNDPKNNVIYSSEHRQERFQNFCQTYKTSDQRKKRFEELTVDEQRELCLADHFDLVQLPPQNVPPGWRQLEIETAESLREYAEEIFNDENKNKQERNDNESCSSGEFERLSGGQRQNQYLHFLMCLPLCPLLHFSFHAVYLHEHGTSKGWCFCPCSSKHMKRWRATFKVHLEAHNGYEYFCDVSQKPAREFLKHIEAKMEECPFHDILFRYLSRLYSTYYGKDKNGNSYRHIAFEHIKTREYKKTMRFLALKDKK